MPWKVVKNGDEHCVEKSDTGERVKCHPTPEAAEKHMRALYANVPETNEKGGRLNDTGDGTQTPDGSFMLWKGTDGLYRWIGRYSNNIRDNDGKGREIISSASHMKFDKLLDLGAVDMPELWLWHESGYKLGRAHWHGYDDSGFSVAYGTIHPGLEDVAEAIEKSNGDWAMSHGMLKKFVERDPQDPSIITTHITTEISLLPRRAAANKRTSFTILKEESSMAFPEHKKKLLLEEGFPPELIEKIERWNLKDATEARQEGVESKDEGQAPPAAENAPETPLAPTAENKDKEPAPAGPDYVTKSSLEEVLGQMVAAITTLNDNLNKAQADLSELKRKDAERLADKAANTPFAAQLINSLTSVIGSPDARVDGRSVLAKDAPVQAPAIAPGQPSNGSLPFSPERLWAKT